MSRVRWVAVPFFFLLGLLGVSAPAQEELTPDQRQELLRQAQKLHAEGVKFYEAGRPDLAADRWGQVLKVRQRLYPSTKYPQGHPQVASALNNLGIALSAAGQPGRDPLPLNGHEVGRDDVARAWWS